MAKVLHISSKYLKDAVIDNNKDVFSIISKYSGYQLDYVTNKPKYDNKNGFYFNYTGFLQKVSTLLFDSINNRYYMSCWCLSKTTISAEDTLCSINNLTLRIGWNGTGYYIGYDGYILYQTGHSINKWYHLSVYIEGTNVVFMVNGIVERIAIKTNQYFNFTNINIGENVLSNELYIDLCEIYINEDIPINPTGYSVGERVFFPPNRYSGKFTPQKNIVDLDASKGLMFSSGIDIKSIYGNNSKLFFTQSVIANQPTYNSIEKAIEFTSANNEYLISNESFYYSKPYTVSFYFKAKTTGSSQKIINLRNGSSSTNYMILRLKNTPVQLENIVVINSVSMSIRASSYTIISSGIWYHYLGVFDGEGYSEYVNGILQAVYAGTFTEDSILDTVELGADASEGTTAMNGYLDDLRIINKVISNDLLGWDSVGNTVIKTCGTQYFTPPPRKL